MKSIRCLVSLSRLVESANRYTLVIRISSSIALEFWKAVVFLRWHACPRIDALRHDQSAQTQRLKIFLVNNDKSRSR